jgi:tetratricopeptide (TPR) repeat protein
MKLALIKTAIWTLSHLIVQKDTFIDAANLYTNKQYAQSIILCNTVLPRLNIKDTLYEKYTLLRGSAYFEMHDFSSSIKDYLVLISLKPKEIPYRINLAYMYGELNRFDDCLTALKNALEVDTTNTVTLSNLSYYSGQFLKYSDAIRYAEKGLKYPADSSVKSALLNNKGYGYIGLKRYSEALNNINMAIKFDPNNSYAYCFRAMAHIRMKQMETVCDDLNKAKELGGIVLTEELRKKYCTLQKI